MSFNSVVFIIHESGLCFCRTSHYLRNTFSFPNENKNDVTYPVPINCALGMGRYFCGHTALVLPQCLSSELSPQSFSPLHSNFLGMQRPGQESPPQHHHPAIS